MNTETYWQLECFDGTDWHPSPLQKQDVQRRYDKAWMIDLYNQAKTTGLGKWRLVEVTSRVIKG